MTDVETTTFALRLIPLMPFLGAAVLMLFGRKLSRDWVNIIAAGAIGTFAIPMLYVTLQPIRERSGMRSERLPSRAAASD